MHALKCLIQSLKLVLILLVVTGAHSAKLFIVFSEIRNKVFVTTLCQTRKKWARNSETKHRNSDTAKRNSETPQKKFFFNRNTGTAKHLQKFFFFNFRTKITKRPHNYGTYIYSSYSISRYHKTSSTIMHHSSPPLTVIHHYQLSHALTITVTHHQHHHHSLLSTITHHRS